MFFRTRFILSAAIVFSLSACVETPPPVAPDISLQNASDSQLHGRMQTTCIATQEKLAKVSYDKVWPSCECYATRTLKLLDLTEKNHWRATNVFNDSARAKALTSIDACKLTRPEISS